MDLLGSSWEQWCPASSRVPPVRERQPTMKIVPPALSAWAHRHGVSSAYLAFALFMLHMAKRGATKHVANENVVAFSQALVPTELAHKLMALNVGLLWWLRKSHSGVFYGWSGSFAALFQAIAFIQFLKFHRANVAARNPICDAMAKSDIEPSKLVPIGELSLTKWIGILLPLPQSMALSLAYPGVRMTRTVTFAHVGDHNTTRLRMDVYKHTRTLANAPILLYIHGGAWMFGTRGRAPMPLIYQCASKGWVVCSVDYRLSPIAAFPDHLTDVKRAVAYLRKNARAEFNADPDFIVVGGESAGGHLASLVALTASDKSFQPGFEEVDTSVKGCIDNYGVHDFTDRHGIYYARDGSHGFVRFMELVVMQKKLSDAQVEYDKASPMSWIDDDKLVDVKQGQVIPPFMLSHGTHDTLVPFDDSQLFFERLQHYRQQDPANRTPVVDDVFIEVPGTHHAFNYLMSPRSLAYGDAVCVFLENLYTKSKERERQQELSELQRSTATLVEPRGASRL